MSVELPERCVECGRSRSSWRLHRAEVEQLRARLAEATGLVNSALLLLMVKGAKVSDTEAELVSAMINFTEQERDS